MAPFFVKLTHNAIFFVLNICAIYLDYVKKPECSGDLSASGRSRFSKMPFAVRFEVGGEYRLNIFFGWLNRRIIFEFGTPES